MKNELSSLTIHQIQTVVSGVKNALNADIDLNSEKESILGMIEQVDYLVGKHDEYCEQIEEVLGAMAEFDFSKKLGSCQEDDNNLINIVSQGLNMLNEELAEKAINKNILRSLLEVLCPDKIILITDNKNNIIFTTNFPQFEDFNEEELRGKPIGFLLNQYDLIIHLMRVESLTKPININLNWKGNAYPSSLRINLALSKQNNLEGIIYLLELEG
jgi:hypothetical protein